jgi:hypothetical protein
MTIHPAIDYRFIVAASLLLSLWLTLLDPLINRDAIIYLRTAEAYLQDGLIASFSVFDRPFLPVLVALAHTLTSLSLLHAGLLLTAVFYAVLSVSFVSIVQLLGGDRRVQLFAAIIILSHPMIAYSRDAIMRDPPYWAFSLLAFRALLLYIREPVFRYQFYWFATIGIASAFRFEGLFFVLLAPLAVLAAAGENRWQLAAKLLVLPAAAIVALTVTVLLYQTVWSPGAQLFSEVGAYIQKLMVYRTTFSEISRATGEALLVFTARDDAAIAALAGLAAILIINIGNAITPVYVITLWWGWKNKLLTVISRPEHILIIGHLLIGLLYLALFTLINRFMLERYSHIFTIFIALYLPFILASAWDKKGVTVAKFIAVTIVVGMTIDVLGHTASRKVYIRDAAQWVEANTAATATLTSNNKYIAYFSHRPFNWDLPRATTFNVADLEKKPQLWRDSDNLAVHVDSEEIEQWRDFVEKNSLSELTTFDGGRHGTVFVMQNSARQ